ARSTWAYWKNLAQARYFRLSDNSRPSEKFLAQAREHDFSFKKRDGVRLLISHSPQKALKNPRSSPRVPIQFQSKSSSISSILHSLIITHTHLTNMRTKSTANRDHPPPKKHKTGTSSQATPSHNRTKFTSVEREERYTLFSNGLLSLSERLDQLKWGTIASPHDKFDPDVVREFYANAYPPEEGGGLFEHKSWVRGKVIRYDREYLNMMLNNPYQVSEDSLDGYHHLVAQNSTTVHGFRIAETVASLCLPGRSVSGNVDGQPKRIYQKDMTTLAQIWMIFCLHNIIPNSHVSSLPLFDCHLLCCIIEGIGIDVARLMATEIYKTAVKGGKKGTMGFPSLITSLCARQEVTVNRTEPIKKPITKQYIKQNCKAETAEL
ncbi:hypothetical protein Lal_00030364, partial [Lupinus albus]